MNEQKYSYCAWGLTASMLLVTLGPKIPTIKNYLTRCPFEFVPVFCCIVAAVMLLLLPRVQEPGYLRLKNQVWGMAFSGAVMFLALRFSVGFLLQNIAVSPYDLSLRGILLNWFGLVPIVAAYAMTRTYALSVVCRHPRYSRIGIVAITLLWGLLEVNWAKIMFLKTSEEWFIYVAKDILPCIAQSVLLTTLVLCGGAVAGIIYSASIGVFTRSFPFLPDLPWIAQSALGITFPVIMSLVLWEWYKTLTHRQTARRQERIGTFTVALVLTVTFSWFVIGVFPIYPSVILTGSMEPQIFPGDIVLIQKLSTEQEIYTLSENDVINFKRENITITHRIIAVLHDQQGNISFQTKGDNNQTADEIIVLPADLNGMVKRIIPKVGFPILWLQTSEPIPEGVSDY